MKDQEIPCLNPDPRWIGPTNGGKPSWTVTCLLDNRAQLNFVMPAYTKKQKMTVFPLERLAEEVGDTTPPIRGIGSILVKPTGFILMRVQVPCVTGYDEDQAAIVLDDPGMKECPMILGTPTLYQVMKVIKESEISNLAILWTSSRVS